MIENRRHSRAGRGNIIDGSQLGAIAGVIINDWLRFFNDTPNVVASQTMHVQTISALDILQSSYKLNYVNFFAVCMAIYK
jgi:hypothetical protein